MANEIERELIKFLSPSLSLPSSQDGRKMGYGAMSGIPMVASSPVRHDSPLNMHGLEVTAYQPPWKALSDFALHADLDNNGAVNTHTPAFQHLVNQVSSPSPSPHNMSLWWLSLCSRDFMLMNLGLPAYLYRCTVTI